MRFVALALVTLLLGGCRGPSGNIDGMGGHSGAAHASSRDEPLLASGAGLYMQYEYLDTQQRYTLPSTTR